VNFCLTRNELRNARQRQEAAYVDVLIMSTVMYTPPVVRTQSNVCLVSKTLHFVQPNLTRLWWSERGYSRETDEPVNDSH